MPTTYAVVKEWRAKNPELVAAQAKRWRDRNPEARKVIKRRYLDNGGREVERESARRRREAQRAADPEGFRERNRRWAAASKARREARLAEEAGRPRQHACELCASTARTVWDHDHASGSFRGWICDRCNKVLGLVRDDPNVLEAMARYLQGGTDGADRQTAQQAP